MNNIPKHNWENILKKKDKNLPDPGSETVTNFPGSIFEPVAGYQALNPTAGTSHLNWRPADRAAAEFD